MASEPLLGKSALVTGGAKRIGRSIALALAHAGADVAITYRSSPAEAQETVAAVLALGRRSVAMECDVRSEASVQAAVDLAAAKLGRIDVLVNNAAIFETAPLEKLSLEQWDAVFETNARGPFLVTRAALPCLRDAGGRVVNLGSLGGLEPWASHAHYCSSKAAVHMLTQTMAKAFAPEIAVNCVAPGWIEMEGDDAELAARFAGKTPMRRNGSPEDVARAVLFFAAESSFVTGQILAVDGGLSL